MPLLGGGRETSSSAGAPSSPARRQSQLSNMAKSAIISSASSSPSSDDIPSFEHHDLFHKPSTLMGPPKIVTSRSIGNQLHKENKTAPSQQFLNPTNSNGHALNDTPISTAPSSPQMYVSQSLKPARICTNISQSSYHQQDGDAKDSCHDARYTWSHQVKSISRRQDSSARCWQ